MLTRKVQVKPFEGKSDEHETRREVKRLFRPLIVCLQVLGVYVPRTRKGVTRVVQLIYCILLVCAVLGNAVRAGLLFKFRSTLGGLSTTVSFFLLYLGMGYLNVVTLISTSRKLEHLIDAVARYHHIYGFAYNLKLLSTRVTLYCWFVTISFACSNAAIMYILSMPENSLNRLLYPFEDISNSRSLIGVIAVAAAQLVSTLVIYMTLLQFGTMCYILNKEFGSVKKYVEQIVEKKLGEDCLEKVRLQHNHIVAVLDKANSLTTHSLFSYMVTGLPTCCLLLYGIILEPLSTFDISCLLFATFFTVCLNFGSTIAGALLNLKAHSSLDDLMRIELQNASSSKVHIISIFISRLTGPQIGFHVYGIFTIDTSTILTIVGTLLTYAVVLIQIRPPGAS